ncbi:MAG: ABC transporter substrate-binding protein [Dehalococcoidia bacterium]
MFETLAWQDDSGKTPQPLLASEWKLIDPLTWRMTLRKDVKFHDGSLLTSADVIYNWQRVNKPDLKSPIPGRLSTTADITAIDANTIEIKTKTPDPIMLKRLNDFAILPKAYLEKVGDAEFGKNPIGTGPMRFKEFRPDDRIVVTRWDEHLTRKPKLTEVTIRVVPDPGARLNGLRTGEVDIADQISIEGGESIKRDGMQVFERPNGVGAFIIDTVGMEGVNPGPLVDKRVRQAINYAVDKETLAKTVYRGFSKPGGQFVQPGDYGYNPDVKPYPYDPAMAKRLLAEAGYPNGFKTTMDVYTVVPGATETAQYVQSQLKDVGVEVELIPFAEFAVYVDKIYKRKPIAPLFGPGSLQLASLGDPDQALQFYWSGQRAFGKRFDSPDFDRLYLASREEMDVAKREAILRDLMKVAHDDSPSLYTVSVTVLFGVSKTVAGYEVRMPDDFRLDPIYRTK